MMNFRDPLAVDAIAEEFCQRLLNSSQTNPDWQLALDQLAKTFPGSFATLLMHRFDECRAVSVTSGEISPQAMEAYESHYSGVNPWISIWDNLPSGSVRISELHSPARMLKGTEFYEDWIKPLGNGEGAVGMKLEDTDEFLIHLPIHFRLESAGTYNEALARIFESIKSTVLMAAKAEKLAAARWVSGSIETVLAIEPKATFILDSHSNVVAWNNAATGLIDRSIACIQNRRLAINQPKVDQWVRKAISDASVRLRNAERRKVILLGRKRFLLEIFLLPESSGLWIYNHDRYTALQFTEFADSLGTYDASLISQEFGLTPSEKKLVEQLAVGRSLQSAANVLGVTIHTARSTLKIVFEKTNTHRQGELVALLNRFLSF